MRFLVSLRKMPGKKLRGSTLVETLTASVIFMIVFMLAMNTLTRLLSVDSDTDYVIIENDLRKCRRILNRSELHPGTRTYPYEWGEVEVDIHIYKNDILQVEMTTHSRKQYRQISYRYLYVNQFP